MVLGSCLFIAACAAGTSGGGGLAADLITRDQIEEFGASDAFDLVRALRPTWLHKRGSTSFYNEGEIRVYLDGTDLGGIEDLRNIHSDNIETLQFLDARQANLRFGPGHEHGVILVLTRK
jgi:hypothetical protein